MDAGQALVQEAIVYTVGNLRSNPTMAIADAIVVGAGIVGAACAAELSHAGLRVVVCQDTDVIGDGATAAGMGHLAVMDDSEAQFALTSYSQALWRDLACELPTDVE